MASSSLVHHILVSHCQKFVPNVFWLLTCEKISLAIKVVMPPSAIPLDHHPFYQLHRAGPALGAANLLEYIYQLYIPRKDQSHARESSSSSIQASAPSPLSRPSASMSHAPHNTAHPAQVGCKSCMLCSAGCKLWHYIDCQNTF